ncbi:histidine kinase [Ramlibacter algicola]|uniref:Histidine kinase n=1 Tax=Ramlibacter algicola TaxID=2795217 RepID=A0A934Q0E2_9BURK|nr:histidine kinase [Ramlibacter algicola]MBK0391992.1 histidine kinase [Ramlibacter algicola]
MSRPDTPTTAPDELDRQVAQLLGAPGDPLKDPDAIKALGLLRDRIGQDVIFVSRFDGGHRIIELVEEAPGHTVLRNGDEAPLEETWCYSVATGRMPEFVLDAREWIESGAVPQVDIQIGTHISTPITLANGAVYGMLCAFSEEVQSSATPNDLARLRLAAQWLGERLSQAPAGTEN